jgi:hypothetical protein
MEALLVNQDRKRSCEDVALTSALEKLASMASGATGRHLSHAQVRAGEASLGVLGKSRLLRALAANRLLEIPIKLQVAMVILHAYQILIASSAIGQFGVHARQHAMV